MTDRDRTITAAWLSVEMMAKRDELFECKWCKCTKWRTPKVPDIFSEATGPVHELLKDPARWCKGEYARDAKGERVSPLSSSACQWCLLGAVRKEWPSVSDECRAKEKIRAALCIANFSLAAIIAQTVFDWNDAPERTHAEVLEVVRKAGI